MSKIPDLFENNRQWAEQMRHKHPDFFDELAAGQNPDYLWIGCADSRVPANEVVGLTAGDMFVHRNVANVVLHSDLNAQSVLQYAIEVLKVKHVIVCGHYGCGGVTAAFEGSDFGLIDNWLLNVSDVIDAHRNAIADLETKEDKINRLCEVNVGAQVRNVCRSPFVQDAWKTGQQLSVHGWIYSLENGHLTDLDLSVSSAEEAAAFSSV
ncbi:MAG: carbonate dehydratase [Fodinibius sp.]|nr:carbonate dehydratase [Fodinibius sp.]